MGEYKKYTIREQIKAWLRLKIKIINRRINNYIIYLWKKYFKKILIGLILISYGVTGTVIFILLSANSKVILVNEAYAKVNDNSRSLSFEETTSNKPDVAVEKSVPLTANGDLVALVRQIFSEDPDIAVAIMKAESQGDKTRIGDKHLSFQVNGQTYGMSYGLFQIRSGGIDKGVFWKRTDNVAEFEKKMLDPAQNVKTAHDIYLKSGFSKWSTFTNGKYKNYL